MEYYVLKTFGQFASRFEGLSLSVSYESCQYNVMITIFAKFWLYIHTLRLFPIRIFFIGTIMIRLRLAKILRTYSEHTQADNQRKMYFIDSFFFEEKETLAEYTRHALLPSHYCGRIFASLKFTIDKELPTSAA